MSSWSWKVGVAGLTIVAATAYAAAQMPGHSGKHEQMGQGIPGQQQMQQTMPQGEMHGGMMHGQRGHHGMMMGNGISGQPTMAGQEVFGTIQEVVKILESDPTTDWSKVNIGALREHLIDMDEVTMRATAIQRPLDDGVEIAVTGEAVPLMRSSAWFPPMCRNLAGMAGMLRRTTCRTASNSP